MVGINPCPIFPPCVSLLPLIPKCSSMMAMSEILMVGNLIYFVDRTSIILSLREVILCMTSQLIIVQRRSSIIFMVMQELTGWNTTEPSSYHRPKWITSLLKHGKLSNYCLQQSPIKLSRRHISPPLPTGHFYKPPSLYCRYSSVKQR